MEVLDDDTFSTDVVSNGIVENIVHGEYGPHNSPDDAVKRTGHTLAPYSAPGSKFSIVNFVAGPL